VIDAPLNGNWLNLALRLRSFCPRADHGPYVVHVTVFVGADNAPVFWTKPTVVLLEPRGTDLGTMLTAFGGSALDNESLSMLECAQ